MIVVEKVLSIFGSAGDNVFDTVCFERPYECASTSARLKYQIVPDIDKRQEPFYNLVCQILWCLNVVITPFRDKLFGCKVVSEPIVVFGIIVNINIVATLMTSDRIEYFSYGDELSIARLL